MQDTADGRVHSSLQQSPQELVKRRGAGTGSAWAWAATAGCCDQIHMCHDGGGELVVVDVDVVMT